MSEVSELSVGVGRSLVVLTEFIIGWSKRFKKDEEAVEVTFLSDRSTKEISIP